MQVSLTLDTERLKPDVKLIKLLHYAWIYFGVVICIITDRRHDYWSYIEQWRLVLAGLNPWGPVAPEFGVNTYGPLQNALAVFLPIHLLAPKVVMFLIFAVAATRLLNQILETRPNEWFGLAIYAVVIPLNMLVTLFSLAFGSNDLLVGAFIVFAILDKLDGKSITVGFWIALAILLKLYPILFLPLFMVHRGRIDLKTGLSALAFTAIGITVAYMIWGVDSFTPYRIAAERGASFLSFFITLTYVDEALTGGAIIHPLLRYNGLVVAIVSVIAALVVWARGYSWMSSFLIVSMISLLTYKVGHQQFFTPWICAVACLPLMHSREADKIAIACLPYMFFLSVFSLVHVVRDPWIFDRVQIWPLLAFPAALWSLTLMLRVQPDEGAVRSVSFGESH